MKQKIIDAAKKIGIDKIGFTTAEPFEEYRQGILEHQEKGYSTGFEHKNLDERLNPSLIFDEPKSIISIALAYPSKPKFQVNNTKDDRRGSFARASWGIDYHHILKEKMAQLIAFIQAENNEANCLSMVDTGALIDVAVAQRAGLGFIGRNGLLITKEYGSYVYLGEIITNLDLEPDSPMSNQCGECYRCISACPPKALVRDGSLKARTCLSYQTQTKDYMPIDYRKKITHVIYGCDICQMVCPYNKAIDNHFHIDMEPAQDREFPSLHQLLTIDNKTFKQNFGTLAGSWRGKKPIQRNAIIALANYRDQSALPKLLQLVETDVRPVIRGTAAWAISQIQKTYNELIIECLEHQLQKETDENTITEFINAIEQLKQKKKI